MDNITMGNKPSHKKIKYNVYNNVYYFGQFDQDVIINGECDICAKEIKYLGDGIYETCDNMYLPATQLENGGVDYTVIDGVITNGENYIVRTKQVSEAVKLTKLSHNSLKKLLSGKKPHLKANYKLTENEKSDNLLNLKKEFILNDNLTKVKVKYLSLTNLSTFEPLIENILWNASGTIDITYKTAEGSSFASFEVRQVGIGVSGSSFELKQISGPKFSEIIIETEYKIGLKNYHYEFKMINSNKMYAYRFIVKGDTPDKFLTLDETFIYEDLELNWSTFRNSIRSNPVVEVWRTSFNVPNEEKKTKTSSTRVYESNTD